MDIVDGLLPEGDNGSLASGPDGGESQVFGGGIELFDVDGDGYLETRVSSTDAGITVAADEDGDGVIDTFTTIQRGGHYETWDVFRAADGRARWERTSAGDVFE